MDNASTLPAAQPAVSPETIARSVCARVWAVLVGTFWAAAWAILIIHLPFTPAVIAVTWALLALSAPRLWLLTFLPSLPFFGNNPGGPHHLYLLDMGIMAYVVRCSFARAARPAAAPAPSPGGAVQSLLVVAFVGLSTGALIPQMKRIDCEIAVQGSRFLFENYSHFGNSPVFGIHAWVSLALSVAFFGCLRRESWDASARARVLVAALAGATLAALLGLLEYAGLMSLEWWRPENPYITRFGYSRLQSLFWHSGWFGQYVAVLAPAALALGLTLRGRARWAAAAVFILLAVAELFTLQRGAWLGFAAGSGAVTAAWLFSLDSRGERIRRLRLAAMACAAAAALLLLAVLLHAPLRHRMVEMAKVSDRSGLWGGAWRMGMTRPLTGIGLGNYNPIHRWLFPEGSEYSTVDDKTTAHSLFLHTFAERGWPAAACLGAMILLTLWAAARLPRGISADPAVPDPGRLAVLGGLSALLVDGIFQYSFYLRVTETLFWLLLAWGAGMLPAPSVPRRSLSHPLVLAGLFACTLAFMAWHQRDVIEVSGTLHREGYGWFHTEGLETEIPVPPEGTRFSILVCSLDPDLEKEPVTLGFWLGGRLVATQVLKTREPVTVNLFFPQDRDPREPLVVKASRVWHPYELTGRLIGKLEAGVCWRDFKPAEQTAPDPPPTPSK